MNGHCIWALMFSMSVIFAGCAPPPPPLPSVVAAPKPVSYAAQLTEAGLVVTVLTIESHGERNLLLKTPDNTAEAKNRRVEITIR